jgi:hypothetical protein
MTITLEYKGIIVYKLITYEQLMKFNYLYYYVT